MFSGDPCTANLHTVWYSYLVAGYNNTTILRVWIQVLSIQFSKQQLTVLDVFVLLLCVAPIPSSTTCPPVYVFAQDHASMLLLLPVAPLQIIARGDREREQQPDRLC